MYMHVYMGVYRYMHVCGLCMPMNVCVGMYIADVCMPMNVCV